MSEPVAAQDMDRRERARLRRANVSQRLRLATDALAAADLLLGLNLSVGSVGRCERPEAPAGEATP